MPDAIDIMAHEIVYALREMVEAQIRGDNHRLATQNDAAKIIAEQLRQFMFAMDVRK